VSLVIAVPPDSPVPHIPPAAPPTTTAAPATLAAVLAQLTEGVIVTDVAGRITFVNDAAARLHGVARLDVPPERYTETYHLLTEDGRPYPPTELPLARAVLRGESVLEARWRIRRPDGSEVLAVGSARPLIGDDGAQVGAVLTVRDDTARAKAQAALDVERRRLARVLEQAPVAVAVVRGRNVADLVYELVNPRYDEIVSRGRAPLGRRVLDVLPELEDAHIQVLQRVLDTREPFVATEYPVPLDRDGDGVVEDHFFSFVYHPLVEPDGTVGGLVAVGTEVTESVVARRHAEALADRLRESEARVRAQARQLETLAENATLALFVMDEHQRCTYMNPAAERLTGFTLGELQGKALHYYVHHTRPDGTPYPLEECPIDQAFPQNMREQGEETFVHKDGSFYQVAFTASPIRQEGRTVGTIIEVRDIRGEKARERERERLLAAEREARAEAETANRAKSEFLAVMSHELRTPLNAIGGYAELLEMELRGPVTPAQREDLDRIQRSQKHLLGLINEVLNYARLETGMLTYDLRPTALADVVATAVPLVEPQRRARGVTLDVALPDGDGARPPLALADRDKLQQILLNLLSNALKFTPEGGRVTLELVPVRDGARHGTVRVVDTGVGIPDDKLEAIFEPFVQVGRSLSSPREGTGLGLAISRDLARGMGGDLTVESTLGQGSTFTLTLPLA
jgi:PAS domain S-box-containing protein